MFIENIAKKFSQEKVTNFLKQNAGKISIFFSIILFAIIITTGYSNHKSKQVEYISTSFNKAIQLFNSENYEGAKEIFLNIEQNKNATLELKNFASMYLAKIFNELGDNNKAIAKYLEVFNNSSNNNIKNISGLNSLMLLISEDKIIESQKIEHIFKNTNLKKGDPFYNLFLEQKSLYKYRAGLKEEAISILNEILTHQIEDSMKERIENTIKAYEFK